MREWNRCVQYVQLSHPVYMQLSHPICRIFYSLMFTHIHLSQILLTHDHSYRSFSYSTHSCSIQIWYSLCSYWQWLYICSSSKNKQRTWTRRCCMHGAGQWSRTMFSLLLGCTTHCNSLQHAATHYNTRHFNTLQRSFEKCPLCHRVAQCTATHCNTLQHTASPRRCGLRWLEVS